MAAIVVVLRLSGIAGLLILALMIGAPVAQAHQGQHRHAPAPAPSAGVHKAKAALLVASAGDFAPNPCRRDAHGHCCVGWFCSAFTHSAVAPSALVLPPLASRTPQPASTVPQGGRDAGPGDRPPRRNA
jgi:hypothetical protein